MAYAIGAVTAAIGAALFYANLPTRYTLGAVVPAVQHLADATLYKVDDEKNVLTAKPIKASQIFDQGPVLVMAVRRPGCAFCRKEAKELSSIKDQLDKAGVRFLGVVHETKGVNEFKPYLAGDVYYDSEKKFFGPKERWLPLWMGFLRFSTYANLYKTKKAGVEGNMEGEGRLLGGVYLINKNEMVYGHLEKEWGDNVEIEEILNALKKL
uniref:Peroxiredoxin-like 2A n=1 Tax=Acrobeloides nanus TaxID=290746 RepID=A0A914E004_9BILA